MNTPVSLEIAKLLVEKKIHIRSGVCYEVEDGREPILLPNNFLYGSMSSYNAPTIADVIMWLYEKHGIWISVFKYKDHAADLNDPYLFRNQFDRGDYDSPKKAYEAGIIHVIQNLIK